jgi:phosphoserine phosphatase
MHYSLFTGARQAMTLFIALILFTLAFQQGDLRAADRAPADPLPSWNEGTARKAITDFVREVIDPANPSFVPPEDRIVTFDLDGTLMPEKPFYIQVAFMAESIKTQSGSHPEWKEEEPFKAILGNDGDYLGRITTPEVGRLLEAAYPGLSIGDYEKCVKSWINTAPHPRFGLCYRLLAYKPMVELIAYLQGEGFKTILCTGSTTEFSRAFSRELFSIPPEQVIGTRLGFEFRESPGGPVMLKKPQVLIFNDRGEKAINLELQIAKRPIMAVGNSNGDIDTFQYMESRKGPSLALLIHHDDADREYAYDRGADKVLELAKERKWVVVSMKNDFRVIFVTEKAQERSDLRK